MLTRWLWASLHVQDCEGNCAESDSAGEESFFGVIDEMRIWRRVRSEEEILNGIYADTQGTQGSDNDIIDKKDDDLVAYWMFDGDSGTTIVDQTGNGHDLQIVGTPEWKVGLMCL